MNMYGMYNVKGCEEEGLNIEGGDKDERGCFNMTINDIDCEPITSKLNTPLACVNVYI